MTNYTILNIIIACLLLSVGACKNTTQTEQVELDEHDELYEDSLELVKAYEFQSKIPNTVQPSIETKPVDAKANDDAADDPAFWYNKDTPSKSIVFGTNKKGGILAIDLEGNTIKYYEIGKVNNVDIIYDVEYLDTLVTLLGCTNRTTQSIDLFIIGSEGDLEKIEDESYKIDSTAIDDVYGFCFGKSLETNKGYAFVNGKNGVLQQFELLSQSSKLSLKKVREIAFDGQTEGMVVDYKTQKLYVGEETKGIWILSVDPTSIERTFLKDSGETNDLIKYDVEGLTIMHNDTSSYLIASSQGNFSYAVFDINNRHSYLGSFKITASESIDGVEETDGIDVTTDSLNEQFPKGIFMAQDGFNYKDQEIQAQNFKYINNEDLLNLIRALQ